jgi:hypothetical protein
LFNINQVGKAGGAKWKSLSVEVSLHFVALKLKYNFSLIVVVVVISYSLSHLFLFSLPKNIQEKAPHVEKAAKLKSEYEKLKARQVFAKRRKSGYGNLFVCLVQQCFNFFPVFDKQSKVKVE